MRLIAFSAVAFALAATVAAYPNTCQPRSVQPFMPIYHLIGNVTTDANGVVTDVESINDASSVFLYKGLYHVFHQCCQNHWDHAVSKDLIHWTRLPPPVTPNHNPTGVPHPDWYDAHGSWDGSLSIPNDWNGLTEPVIVMTAVEGTPPHASRPADWAPEYVPRAVRAAARKAGRLGVGGGMGMAVVHATNSSDPFLLSWTKDTPNPIAFTSGAIRSPYDTPGEVWKNGDHWNYLDMGVRYTTKDPTLHTWGTAPGRWPTGETGGEWFGKIANLKDGSPPPPGSPGWMVNVGPGQTFALGEYDAANESWTTVVPRANIDAGPNAAWMAAQFAGDRFMNIGWSLGGPPMMVEDFPDEATFGYTQRPASAANTCAYTSGWEVMPGFTNIYNRMPSPTNVTHGTLHFIGLFDSAEECFAGVNASTAGPFHSFTYNDATLKDPYGRHCWADTSMVWQGRGGAKGQTSGRGPGFPIPQPIPPTNRFTHDHLTGLREVAYDPVLKTLVSNPVRELVNLRNGTLGSGKAVAVAAGAAHVVPGTGVPADASTSDVVVNVTVPSGVGAVGVSVLANVSNESPFGGILTMVNFTAPDSTGIIKATASIRTLNPCGPGSAGVAQASFPILKGETVVDIRLLVDRSLVEAFVMGGRVVFSKTYNPGVMYVPDTNVALQAWGTAVTADIDVFSMGCGWSDPPYQPNPTFESISKF